MCASSVLVCLLEYVVWVDEEEKLREEDIMMDRNSIFYKIRRKLQVLALDLTSNEFMSKIYFKIVLGYELDLDNPKSFNQKLQWLKLKKWPYDKRVIQCADKYLVRNYIKSIGKSEILNELYYAWDSVKEIDWDALPEKFVLKCNHGCGYNILCKNKKKLSKEVTLKQLDEWMKEDFSKFNAEPHYSKIPRKIICEKYLEGEVINYNIYVLNGKAVFFSVAGGLGDGIDEHLTYYNVDGSQADFKNKAYPAKVEKLSSLLPNMISMAEFIAKGFPMVRVDLFDIKGKIVFSEMTFTPGGGLIPFDPLTSDYELGEKLDIKGK